MDEGALLAPFSYGLFLMSQLFKYTDLNFFALQSSQFTGSLSSPGRLA